MEQNISDVLASVSVITRQDIERAQAPTLVDLIQGQAGIEIGRNGGPGTTASIFMRGQASTNVAVFVDGVPLQRDAYGVLRLIDLPPNQIEKIEILRGNMGAVYGESAVGGAIHIFTRAGSAASGPSATSSYGSRNSRDLAAAYRINQPELKLAISMQHFASDGYSAMNARQNPKSVNPDKDSFERSSLFAQGEMLIGNALSLGLQANRIDAKLDYDSSFNPFTFGAASPLDRQRAEQQSSDLTLYGRFKPMAAWSSRLALTQSRIESQDFYNSRANGSYDGDQRALQWDNSYKIGNGNASFGFDLVDAAFKTSESYKRESRAYFAGYSARVDRLDYQANLRRDEINATSGNTSNDKSASSWLLGAGYAMTDQLKLTALLSTAFRAPAVGELFGFYGNPKLEPQKHKGSELGLQHQSALGRIRAVYFSTDTQNDFGYGPDYKPYNIVKSENKGFELSIAGNAAGWAYQLSAVSQDPRNAETGTALARRSKAYGSVDLTKTALGIDWASKIFWSASRKDSDFNSFVNASYAVVNLTASTLLSPQWRARVKLENAFGARYQLAYGYDAVPRGLFIGLQYQPLQHPSR